MGSNMSDISFSVIPVEDIEDGKRYHIKVSIPTKYGFIDNVTFMLENRKGFHIPYVECRDDKAVFEVDIDLKTRAIYRYYCSYTANEVKKHIKNVETTSVDRITHGEMFKMSVNYEVPRWAKGKIQYHIFVDRFRRGSNEPLVEMPRRTIHRDWNEEMVIGPDSNGIWNADFYGGDLKGIEKSLKYIKSLGTSIIYLSPIVWSQSNHRYDTSDYENVDPYAGCNEDLKSLCDKAHSMGMKVVLDAVFNHTGNDSKYFNEYGTFDSVGAFQSRDSSYNSFYRKNSKGEFDYWWGMKNLPVCDGNSREWQEYICGVGGVIDKWFSLGIDGLRLDVADELTDEFIEMIRVAVKRNKEDGFILGEVWKNPMRMGRGYIESGKGMDSVMNYTLIDAIIRYFKYGDVNKLAYIIRDIKNEYPEGTINALMNFTSTHDISRAINIFGSNLFLEYGEWAWNPSIQNNVECSKFKLSTEEYKRGREIYEAYMFLLTFMPGIVSIFYGDEVGLEGLGNLANRKVYPWGHRDKKLLEYFRELGRIRNSEKFLETADLNIYDINKDYMMFEREADEEKVLVIVSRVPEEKKILVPGEYEKEDGIYRLKKSMDGYIGPYGGVAIKKRK